MTEYRLADLTVGIDTEEAGRAISAHIKEQMKAYECADGAGGRPQISVHLTKGMIEEERRIQGPQFPVEYLASIAVYRAFCEQALSFDTLFFHSSAVALDGEAFLFSGPSGSGKSTHAAMWKEAFGDRAVIVNDDKPLIRFLGDRTYVYGTPWDGKFHRNENLRVPVRAICFLSRAQEISIRKIGWQEAKILASDQSFHAGSPDHRHRMWMLTNMMLNRVPVYRMDCDISVRAAETAHRFMVTEAENNVHL